MANPDDSLMLSILKEIRADQRTQGSLLLHLAESVRRHDRRFNDVERRFNDVERRFNDMDRRFGDLENRLGDLSGEWELILKSELMGRLTHFETQVDEKIARLSDRLDALENAE
jgi:chromosome segregation ATPase